MSAVPDRSPPAGRSSADIADEARTIRDDMDRTLDEIGYRLSPGQLSNAAVDVVRDVLRGGDGPVSRSLRANPLPVILIGVGFLWLAWEASRVPHLDGEAVGDSGSDGFALSPQRSRILLTGLIGATRQGAARFRRVEGVIAEPTLSAPLRRSAEALDLGVESLCAELRRLGGEPDPDPPGHPIWAELDALALRAEGHERVFAALASGLDGLSDLYRDSLKEDWTPALKVVIGARFHELEIVRHEVSNVREGVA